MIPDLSSTVAAALREDLGHGDITTTAVVDPSTHGRAHVAARVPMVVCGLPVIEEVFSQVDGRSTVTRRVREGDAVDAGATLAEVSGPLAGILTAERVALNFMQRMSGVATWTRRHVEAIAGSGVRLVDTRKTTPGLRAVEKYAVRIGGAHNHRFALDDGVMVKDNHIVAAGSVTAAVTAARCRVHHLVKVQCEVDRLEQAHEAVAAGAEVLLLDNFTVDQLTEAVTVLRASAPGVVLEASGGVKLETLPAIAGTGVDVISCGSLIHQARWIDIGLDFLT
ncbi:MAG: carboxylating nicotinate-nucleotide diphosphorylase [Proteobacteria bacterium]|nr:carboxylating nicotinate-nucleotide diphosphorylase [Pseudomonadota bacterium]